MRDGLFMGAVTATAMHDMLNVLSTIRELAGLMNDLLAGPAGKGFAQRDRFCGMLGVVEEQVVKGSSLAEELNRFGHLPEGGEPHDAARLARMLVALLNRRARTRGVGFLVEESRKPLPVSPAAAFDVARTLYQIMETGLETLGRGEQARLVFAQQGCQGALTITPDGPGLADRILASCSAHGVPQGSPADAGLSLARSGANGVLLLFPLEAAA